MIFLHFTLFLCWTHLNHYCMSNCTSIVLCWPLCPPSFRGNLLPSQTAPRDGISTPAPPWWCWSHLFTPPPHMMITTLSHSSHPPKVFLTTAKVRSAVMFSLQLWVLVELLQNWFLRIFTNYLSVVSQSGSNHFFVIILYKCVDSNLLHY